MTARVVWIYTSGDPPGRENAPVATGGASKNFEFVAAATPFTQGATCVSG